MEDKNIDLAGLFNEVKDNEVPGEVIDETDNTLNEESILLQAPDASVVSTPPKYKLPKLEAVELDKNKINNMLDKNEIYYIIYSDTCPMCIILLKYLKYIKFNYKLVHVKDLTQMDSKLTTIAVPYILNSKKQKVNIHSLLEILREHNIKSLK